MEENKQALGEVEETEEEPDMIEIVDEEGNQYLLEVIDAIEHEDPATHIQMHYMAMIPVDEEQAESEELQVVFMKTSLDPEDDALDIVDDDEEYRLIGDIFAPRLKKKFDIQ